MIEVGDIVEYIEHQRVVPLGTPDAIPTNTYWIVLTINDSGSCTLLSLEKNYTINEFTAFLNDPEVYKKL